MNNMGHLLIVSLSPSVKLTGRSDGTLSLCVDTWSSVVLSLSNNHTRLFHLGNDILYVRVAARKRPLALGHILVKWLDPTKPKLAISVRLGDLSDNIEALRT
jgi:hypothetical protein